ncbi:MAG: VCBS repeat-containing protein [Candidatus Krumholzibacteriota bacterium]|nr:VCBS repeat-containing protein [Candidatus Krumholzibacteriota bacterium]
MKRNISIGRGFRCRNNLAAKLIMAWSVVALGLQAAQAGDEHIFKTSTLSVPGTLLYLETEDLNKDGLKDIFIVHRKGLHPDYTRWSSVFWQRKDGGFSTAADQSWEIDSSAVIMDMGDVTGDGNLEICYLTASGVFYYPLRDSVYAIHPVNLFEAGGLTVFPSKRTVPLVNFVRDWNDDGVEEVGVYGFKGLSLFSPNPQGDYRISSELEVELHTRMGRVYMGKDDDLSSGVVAHFSFPPLKIIDFNNDGKRDLVAIRDDRLFVYLGEERGTYRSTPSENLFFDVMTQKEKIERIATVETIVHDLNGDGFADAIVTKQTNKGLTNFRGVINLFYGGKEGFKDQPDQVIISEGTASARTHIRDVNGDGRLDLILPSVKISVTSIIRFLLTRSVPINFNIFLLNENNEYSDRPDFTKEVKFKIDLSGESDSQAMDLDGDYNGDDRKDFIFGTQENELSIYLGVTGEEDRLFSKKPAAKVEAAAFGELFSPDLNNDGYSDIVIYYPQSKKREGMVQVLMNLKELR